MPFQSTVNIFPAFGVVGELAFDGPLRAAPYNLQSSGIPNKIGYAFTRTSDANPDPATDSSNAAVARVGGSGLFAGILVNPKSYASFGGSTGPLSPTLVLADYTIGELLIMGEIFVYLPGPAAQGDFVTYDPSTGALNSIAPLTMFTASIAPGGASTPDVMTVSAVSKGKLAVGQQISGAGIPPGTYIISLGTGLGYTGTYNISTINSLTVSSEAMTAPNVPAPAFAGTGHIDTAAGVDTLTISAVSSGELVIGQAIFGAGIPDGTTIASFGSGTGGTGTYILSSSGLTIGSEAITAPANVLIPNCVVSRVGVTAAGLAVIRLTI